MYFHEIIMKFYCKAAFGYSVDVVYSDTSFLCKTSSNLKVSAIPAELKRYIFHVVFPCAEVPYSYLAVKLLEKATVALA